jgi:hypothetical protein
MRPLVIIFDTGSFLNPAANLVAHIQLTNSEYLQKKHFIS